MLTNIASITVIHLTKKEWGKEHTPNLAQFPKVFTGHVCMFYIFLFSVVESVLVLACVPVDKPEFMCYFR